MRCNVNINRLLSSSHVRTNDARTGLGSISDYPRLNGADGSTTDAISIETLSTPALAITAS